MSDGAPNIAGPIGGLLGIGVMALAAKGVIDIVKEQQQRERLERKKRPLIQEPRGYTPRPESDVIDRGLNRMLGR